MGENEEPNKNVLHKLVEDVCYVVFTILKEDISSDILLDWLKMMPRKRGRAKSSVPPAEIINWFRSDPTVLWGRKSL